jgi:hypothetical protein
MEVRLMLLGRHHTIVVLKLAELLILLFEFRAAFSEQFILATDLMVVTLQVSIATFQSTHCSFTVILHILELGSSCVDLDTKLLNLVVGQVELLEEILVLTLVLVKRLKVGLELIVHFALNELLQR